MRFFDVNSKTRAHFLIAFLAFAFDAARTFAIMALASALPFAGRWLVFVVVVGALIIGAGGFII